MLDTKTELFFPLKKNHIYTDGIFFGYKFRKSNIAVSSCKTSKRFNFYQYTVITRANVLFLLNNLLLWWIIWWIAFFLQSRFYSANIINVFVWNSCSDKLVFLKCMVFKWAQYNLNNQQSLHIIHHNEQNIFLLSSIHLNKLKNHYGICI